METNEAGEARSPELIDLSKIEGAFTFAEGFSRPDWALIGRAIVKSTFPEDRNAAWTEAATQWALQLQRDLGGRYQVDSSKNFLLLSELEANGVRSILDFAERALEEIGRQLGQAAWRPGSGKHVIFLFTEDDDYYQYVTYFLPDGVHPASGGCLLSSNGYVHIAIPSYDGRHVRSTIVHELTHNCLVHLPIPLWLNEGLAQLFERALGTSRRVLLDSDLRDEHFAFWDEETIQKFWAGLSFYEPGDSNKLSYSLAEILVNLLMERKESFVGFIQSAGWRDAGQTAVVDALSMDLGAVAETFLGEGQWRPSRKTMAELWRSERAKLQTADAKDSAAQGQSGGGGQTAVGS